MDNNQENNQTNAQNPSNVPGRQGQTHQRPQTPHNNFQNKGYNPNYRGQQNHPAAENSREISPNRTPYRERDNQHRPYSNSNSIASRFSSRNRSEETIEDIKAEIIRIEKEIDLEIKEIKSMKL